MKFGTRIVTAIFLLVFLFGSFAMEVKPAKAAPCYWAQFVADVTIPDGTSFAANTAFRKTWRLKNIGSCTWNSGDVSLVFDNGERMNASASVAIPSTVYPGQTVDITVDMTAPANAGHYFGYWKLKSNSGGVFGIGPWANRSFWVEIYVTSPTSAGYDFMANASSATWSSGAGYLAFPGTYDSPSGFGIRQDVPYMENGATGSQPGLLFVPNSVTNGYIQAVYPAFRVQRGDRFQATIGCEYGSSNCYVAYKLYYQIGSGPVKTFWTFRERYEGMIYNVNLDLSPLANQDVNFILAVQAYGSPVGDHALWVNPIIARAGVVASPTALPLPDLFISSAYLGMQGMPNPNACVPNYAPYEIRVTVQNRGQTQAVSIPVVMVSTGAQQVIGLLRAGQSTEVYFPANTPQATNSFVIDPQNSIPELDETNNTYSYLAVTPTPPMLCTPAAISVTPTFTPTPTQTPQTNAMIVWQSADTPCRTASFWSDRMTYGYCPPSLSPINQAYPELEDYISRYSIWMRAYAPFTAQTRAGTVTFNGSGYVIATEAEQRMMAEWAARMYNEVPSGRSSTDGLVISAHFSGDNTCFDASVYKDGHYFLSSCLSGFVYPAPHGYLDANELLYFYRWLDGLQPYQDTSASRGLAFAGQGPAAAQFTDKISIETLVLNLEARARASTSGGGIPSASLAAQRVLSMQLGIPLDQIQVRNVESVSFPDSCLGAPKPNEVCKAITTSGFRVQLVAQGLLYEFHTDAAGYDLRQFGSPQPAPQEAG